MNFIISLAFMVLLTPILTYAAPNFGYVNNLATLTIDFITKILVPLVFAIAILAFLWGMFKTFILGGDDEDKQKEGKQLMLYAIAGFVIMVSLWGIVGIVRDIFGIDAASAPNQFDLPAVPKKSN